MFYNENFDFDDLVEVNEESKSLGKGSYGEVKLFKHKESGLLYAVKIIQKEFIQKHCAVSVLLREIQIHRNLKHGNIVQMVKCFEDDERVFIVLEYVSQGNLFRIIRRSKGLSEEAAWSYFTQTCLGIKYLHDNGIIHRDLKPENILIDQSDNVKICDFGWCVQSNEIRNTFCGTLEYMAPEMLQNKGHTYHVDLWALGILLFELIHGNAPFVGKSDSEKRKQILSNKIPFGAKVSREAQNLIENLVKPNPNDRFNINQILAHDWVQKYCKEKESLVGVTINHPELGSGEVIEHKGLVCVVKFGQNYSVLAVNDVNEYKEIQRVTYSGIEKEAFDSLEKWCGKKKKTNNILGIPVIEDSKTKEFYGADNGTRTDSVKVIEKDTRKVTFTEEFSGVFDFDETKEIIENRIKNSRLRQQGFQIPALVPKNKRKDLYSKDSTDFQDTFNVSCQIDVSDSAYRNRIEQLEVLRKTLETANYRKKPKKKSSFWDNWFGCLDR